MTAPRPMPTPDLAGLLTKTKTQTSSLPFATPANDGPGTASPDEAERPEITHLATADTATTPPATSAKPRGKQYLRSITIYLPRSVHQHIATEATARNTTRTALILAAINATHTRLASALAERNTAPGDHDLFDIPQDRTAAEPSVQTTIRVTDSQLAAIENLVSRHRTNRSHLITAALQLHLR